MKKLGHEDTVTNTALDESQSRSYVVRREVAARVKEITAAILVVVFLLGMVAPRLAYCTGISVSNIALGSPDTVNGNVPITFDLSWGHSWRTSSGTSNWYAAWVFVKYRVGSGAWTHARLNNTGNSGPSSATVTVGLADPSSSCNISTNPGVGVFVYRSADGTGTFSPSGVNVSWNCEADSVSITSSIEVQVFAIEMVYVREGAFYAGDNAT
jgi:hypothetical protein